MRCWSCGSSPGSRAVIPASTGASLAGREGRGDPRESAHRTGPPGELKARDPQEAVLATSPHSILFQQNTRPFLHRIQF